MFFKEQPEKPAAGVFASKWSGGSFIITLAATGAEVLRFCASSGKVTLPAGSIPGTGLADEAVTSDKLAPGVIQMASISLTNAEIKALNTAAKELVAAPGAGKLIEFLGATLFHNYGSNALTGNHDMTIGLNGGTVAVAAVVPFAGFPLKTADFVYTVNPAIAFSETAANALNKNLALLAAGDFAGNAGADTVWTVNVAYRIHDFS
jgi:hypothetical protein